GQIPGQGIFELFLYSSRSSCLESHRAIELVEVPFSVELMRDYLIMAIVLASLPIGLFRPFYGLLVYAWISYMYPHELAWSFAKSFPVAKLSAFSVMGGLLFSPTGNIAALRQKENVAMLLFWVTFTISSVFAI